MDEEPRALDVREELVTEPGAAASALDQPGMSATTSWRSSASSVPSTRLERRERIPGDLRRGARQARDQR